MRILTDLKNQENRVKGGDTRPFYLLFTEIKKEQGKISLKSVSRMCPMHAQKRCLIPYSLPNRVAESKKNFNQKLTFNIGEFKETRRNKK